MENEILEPETTLSLLDFSKASQTFTTLISGWDTKISKPAKIRRNMRSIEIDVSGLQREGKLKVDETIIPIRVIDSNIKAEQPPFISYVKQSQRLAVFRCMDNPQIDDSKKQIIEKDFTNVMTYNGWEKWIYRLVDGAQLHGFTCVEVEFDELKPGNVSIHAYPHEDVIFPLKARDLEFQPFILCRIPFTLHRLQEIGTKYGFDQTQLNLILAAYKEDKEDKDIIVYKAYIKNNGVVNIAWINLDDSCNDWLKAPAPLWLGRNKLKETIQTQEVGPGIVGPVKVPSWEPIIEVLYPIKIYKYQETEDSTIVDTKGRAFLDGANQEAQTALYSAFINTAVRASNVYGSPKQGTGSTQNLKKLNMTLEHGCLYNEPMEFWHTDQPSFDMIRGAQALDVRKQMETGQIATAAMSREDSRKLAKELELAKQTSDMLSSVQITNFAICLTEVFTTAWAIVQSRALQERISFAQIQDPTTGQYKNDLELIAHDYQVKPAGDQDIIGRAQKIQTRLQAVPILQQGIAMVGAAPLAAPLIVVFYSDMLREMFPEDADKYIGILNQLLMQQQQMIQMQQQKQQTAGNPNEGQPQNIS